jgi:thiamine-phosphate diphosphorylase
MMCLVTDRRRLSNGSDAVDRLVALVSAAARAGIDIVQVRERDLSARALSSLVRRCVAAAAGTQTKVVVNDRADVAMAADADGVHLRGDSIAAPTVRALLRKGALIGRSVHSAGEASGIARAGGVDYLLFGALHPTASKDAGHPVTTIAELSAACRVAVPVLAIGGMTVERAAAAARAGAAGIAGIGLFVPPDGVSADQHLQSIAAALRSAFDTSGAVP